MKLYIKLFIMSFSFFSWLNLHSQVDKSIHIDRLASTLSVLAHDSLQGREAGTIYEVKARDFIIQKFQEIELDPLFGDSFIQEFEFQAPADYSKSNFIVNGKALRAGLDFYPLNKSAIAKIKANSVNVEYGIETEDYSNYENLSELDGKIFIIDIASPEELGKQSFDIESRINLAVEKGAKGIVLINSSKGQNPKVAISQRESRYDVPVVFSSLHEDIKKMALNNAEIALEVEIEFNTKKSYNVAGYLDAGREKSIVLGAHYDHLGMGGPTSRFLKEAAIHNGADDNASGVAAIIEIARYFSENPEARDNLPFNLIIAAFSAEEKGLYGSMEFANDTNIISSEKIHSMLNYDMVGRLIKNELTVIGTGTAEEWAELMDITKLEELKVKAVESSSGGSDHISFYSKEIPVLFFFTGIHDHYHHPDDDFERLNLEGMADIVNYSILLIQNMREFQELSYVKLDIADNKKRTKDYKVTLGIMPDYAGGGKGLKVMSVSPDKPADKAGIIDGDIIIQMGDVKIGDIYDYMESLAKFNKGDKIKVVIMRQGKKLSKDVEF